MKTALSRLSLLVLLILPLARGTAQDARIQTFEKWNRATSYEELQPLVSGTIAAQLASLRKNPQALLKVLEYMRLTSYQAKIVEVNPQTSLLVVDHAVSARGKEPRFAYLLSRGKDGSWTIENRVLAQSVITSMWEREYSPDEFNQPSNCMVRGADLPPSLNGKQWSMQSAVAFRDSDKIEIDLFPFRLRKADIDFWRSASGMADGASARDSSFLSRAFVCRIVLGLDPAEKIHSVNVGFDAPGPGRSQLWLGPGWAWSPPKVPAFKTSNGLPPEFPTVEIRRDRIILKTAGTLHASDTIRWSATLDIPLLHREL